jgi:hypothetical protein
MAYLRHWRRYAYANNNPLYYTDPSGHIPTCGDDECELEPNVDDLRDSIEEVYAVEIEGNWSYNELLLMNSVLNLYADYLGGVDHLNALTREALVSHGLFDRYKIGLHRFPGNGKSGSVILGDNGHYAASWCGGSKWGMCWGAQGDIVFSDNIFTKDYQDLMQNRQGFNLSPNQGAMVTMAHELTHVFADARPGAVSSYGKLFSGRPGKTSDVENMANVMALYLVTGGASWANTKNNALWVFPSAFQQYWQFQR